jgi:hypothetical protein
MAFNWATGSSMFIGSRNQMLAKIKGQSVPCWSWNLVRRTFYVFERKSPLRGLRQMSACKTKGFRRDAPSISDER